MDKKKLFEVEIRDVFYALAENEVEARRMARQAVRDMIPSHRAKAQEVTHREWPLGGGWLDISAVYHAGDEEITVGEELEKLPAKSP